MTFQLNSNRKLMRILPCISDVMVYETSANLVNIDVCFKGAVQEHYKPGRYICKGVGGLKTVQK